MSLSRWGGTPGPQGCRRLVLRLEAWRCSSARCRRLCRGEHVMTVGDRRMRSASMSRPQPTTTQRRASTGFLYGVGSWGGRGRCRHARPFRIAPAALASEPKGPRHVHDAVPSGQRVEHLLGVGFPECGGHSPNLLGVPDSCITTTWGAVNPRRRGSSRLADLRCCCLGLGFSLAAALASWAAALSSAALPSCGERLSAGVPFLNGVWTRRAPASGLRVDFRLEPSDRRVVSILFLHMDTAAGSRDARRKVVLIAHDLVGHRRLTWALLRLGSKAARHDRRNGDNLVLVQCGVNAVVRGLQVPAAHVPLVSRRGVVSPPRHHRLRHGYPAARDALCGRVPEMPYDLRVARGLRVRAIRSRRGLEPLGLRCSGGRLRQPSRSRLVLHGRGEGRLARYG